MLTKSRTIALATALLLPLLGACVSTSGADVTAVAPQAGDDAYATTGSGRLWPDLQRGGE